MGALNYNLKKLNLPDKRIRGELLASNFMSIDSRVISKEIGMVRSLRPNLNRYVYHTSLNFPNEDQSQLSNDKLLAIALDYLQANGFTNNQYMIFRHHDACHPHLHLLVNRISFDGTVVSDSNNYRKSEKILRELEYRYNLISVEQSNFRTIEQNSRITKEQNSIGTKYQKNLGTVERNNNISRRRPTRNEVGMMIRTGKASNKLLLQELILELIRQQPKSIAEFIRNGEKFGISFLFNQASTGRVSGITYFFKDFRAKGQGLGNQFKWAELIRKVPFDPQIDSAAIAEANNRTMGKFGLTPNTIIPDSINEAEGHNVNSEAVGSIMFEAEGLSESKQIGTDSQTVDLYDQSDANSRSIDIQIADDIDDEAVLGRNRHRKKMARTNRR